MIAVTFALPAESSGFRRLMEGQARQMRSGVKIIQGRIKGKELTLLHTGVGREKCEARMEAFLRDQSFEFLVSAGFAGGLSDKLEVGDLLIAGNFSEPNLVSSSVGILPATRVERLFTSPAVIDSISERQEAGRSTGAAAVDMETEFIAAACEARSLPMIAMRVITDTPSQPFPLPPHVLFDFARQKTEMTKLFAYLATHPGRILPVMCFAGRIGKARARLTDALELLVREL
jgi:adenosylhomocysteine nucleosidase